jgi:hypothetical protein
MESIVDSFLNEYSLTDPGAKDSLIEVINSCFKVYAQYMSKELLDSNTTQKKPKEPKEPKKKPKESGMAALENPADATSLSQLEECTVQVLSKFCKERSLKVGGKKESLSLRVWRFLQGETSDEDRSSVKGSKESSSPKEPKKNPKNTKNTKNPIDPCFACQGMTKSGTQCVLAGTKELAEGQWYCFRHYPKQGQQESGEEDSDDSESSGSTNTKKTPKEPKNPKNPKKESKNHKKKVIQLDSEPESE